MLLLEIAFIPVPVWLRKSFGSGSCSGYRSGSQSLLFSSFSENFFKHNLACLMLVAALLPRKLLSNFLKLFDYFYFWHSIQKKTFLFNVPDPNPDPRVFWPSGSGSTSQRYGSGSGSGFGSGSFYYHAKIIRKTLNTTFLWLFFIYYLWKIM